MVPAYTSRRVHQNDHVSCDISAVWRGKADISAPKKSIQGYQCPSRKAMQGYRFPIQRTMPGYRYQSRKPYMGTKFQPEKPNKGSKLQPAKLYKGTKFQHKMPYKGTNFQPEKTRERDWGTERIKRLFVFLYIVLIDLRAF